MMDMPVAFEELPYDSRSVANHFIRLARGQGRSMTIMRVLRISYMAQGWTLALLDRPLVNDHVQAWKHGPVIPGIYYAFRPYGAYDMDPVDMVREDNLGTDVVEFLAGINAMYEDVSDWQLSQLTHLPRGPWARTYTPGIRHNIIPNEMIKEHFKSKMERAGKSDHVQ